MSSAFDTPGPGRNVAILRKKRDMSQAKLARAAGVSISLLSKIEIGDRTLSQGVAAALARAMGITLDELLGGTEIQPADEARLKQLRDTIRRFDIPGEAPEDADSIQQGLAAIIDLRSAADLSGLLDHLPDLLTRATNYAHATSTPTAWGTVADTYSAVYWLAARHRWMDLAELAIVRQKIAAQRATPLVAATAARDEAGAFLNSGDFEGGLAVIDRAVVDAESSLSGRQRALGCGLLHLRGLTLAGRLGDRAETERHASAAWRAAGEFPQEVNVHGIGFGSQETANHLVATYTDLEDHRKALDIAERLNRQPKALRPTGVVRFHMNTGRARLSIGDRDGAVDELVEAWDAAPQVAKVHPASQELLRVLVSLHRRSNPTLLKLVKRAGLTY